MKALKFKGQKVHITLERIPESERDAEKFYYEIKADDENPSIPILIQEEVDEPFWGTMITEEEFELNQGDYHSLAAEMGKKLAEKFGLLEG